MPKRPAIDELPVPLTMSVLVDVIAPPKNPDPEKYPAPWTLSEDNGVVVPMPTLPVVESTRNLFVPTVRPPAKVEVGLVEVA